MSAGCKESNGQFLHMYVYNQKDRQTDRQTEIKPDTPTCNPSSIDKSSNECVTTAIQPSHHNE